MITYRLSRHSGVPTYLQIVRQTEQAIRMGTLREGDQLPPVRNVVVTLAINPNTVFKAYRELEDRGLVEGRIGSGTLVLEHTHSSSAETQTALAEALNPWIEMAHKGGLDDEAIEALVHAVLQNSKRKEN